MTIDGGRSSLSRRAFLGRTALVVGASVASLTALGRLSARSERTEAGRDLLGIGYGPLGPVTPSNAEEIVAAGFPDLATFPILALPPGFQYRVFSIIGGTLSDGNAVPVNHDGMAAFAHPHDPSVVRLIRNQEDRRVPGQGSVGGPIATRYDALGGGGTVTLDYDERGHRLVQDYISLNGTIVNCAGGIGFGARSWLTCEETVAGSPTWGKPHGYVFEVPLDIEPGALRRLEPLTALGRFAHEAVSVDQRTGIVYLTEDAGPGVGSGFYRFLPVDPADLSAGGTLQMLGVVGAPQANLREGQTVGVALRAHWFDITDPDPANPWSPRRTFYQGLIQGGAEFNRLEGCWFDGGQIFFVSTSGGDVKNGVVDPDGFHEGYGQVWRFVPDTNVLQLVFESPGASVLESPDNITVTPRGGLLFCEDDPGSLEGDAHPLAPGIIDVNRLIGLTPSGEAFEFTINALNDSEWAGACFSPSGRTLFANIFGDGSPGSGMTVAITGPWSSGPL